MHVPVSMLTHPSKCASHTGNLQSLLSLQTLQRDTLLSLLLLLKLAGSPCKSESLKSHTTHPPAPVLLVVQSLANPFSFVVWLIKRVGPSACKEISKIEEYTTSVSGKKLQYLKRASTRQKVPIRSLRREGCDAVVEENKLSYTI